MYVKTDTVLKQVIMLRQVKIRFFLPALRCIFYVKAGKILLSLFLISDHDLCVYIILCVHVQLIFNVKCLK